MGAIVARGPASAGVSSPLFVALADEPKADGYEDDDGREVVGVVRGGWEGRLDSALTRTLRQRRLASPTPLPKSGGDCPPGWKGRDKPDGRAVKGSASRRP
jgi:hypothetical protein